MFPLAFLIIGCVTFTILGFVILASVPFFRVTFLNLSVFPLGAIPAAIAFLFVYGRLFSRNQLGDRTFYRIFPVLSAGGTSFGVLAVMVKMRFGRRNS
jgi:hypothetical protein